MKPYGFLTLKVNNNTEVNNDTCLPLVFELGKYSHSSWYRLLGK